MPARRYHTRQGVHTPQEWQGFLEVWREAAALNHLVVDAFTAAGLPVMAFPPSAGADCQGRPGRNLGSAPLESALQAGLLPVVYGDVVFDRVRGGTIFSTEDLFEYLALRLRPERILLAGLEPGVWGDYPRCAQLVSEITPENLGRSLRRWAARRRRMSPAAWPARCRQSLDLVQATPACRCASSRARRPESSPRPWRESRSAL